MTYVGGGSNAAQRAGFSGSERFEQCGRFHRIGYRDQPASPVAVRRSAGNTVRLDDAAASFLSASATQAFTFHINTGTGGNQDVTTTLNGGTNGLSGTQVDRQPEYVFQAYGITASIASDGTLQFGGASSFTVNAAAASAGTGVTAAGTAVNSANYNITSGTFAAFATGGGTAAAESFVVQNATAPRPSA